MQTVFVSYRRSDSEYVTDRIVEKLAHRYGHPRIIRDVESFAIGKNFRDSMNEALADCQVVLVVIGKGWLDARDEAGLRRIDNENDWVRIEVETALERNIVVIPLLVDHANMPKAVDLPLPLRNLPLMNGLEIRPDPVFNFDADLLCGKLDKVLNFKSYLKNLTIPAAIGIALFGALAYRVWGRPGPLKSKDNSPAETARAEPPLKSDSTGLSPERPSAVKPGATVGKVYREFTDPYLSNRYGDKKIYDEALYTNLDNKSWRMRLFVKTLDGRVVDTPADEIWTEENRGDSWVILTHSGNVPKKLADGSVYVFRNYPSSPVPPDVDPEQVTWWKVSNGQFESPR